MKFIKWKSLSITCILCLMPILLGLVLWDKLPETMAIHFDINNNPDNFASKGFVVFGLPALMALLQMICCILDDFNAKKHGKDTKAERVPKWILPCVTIVLEMVTLGYGLGWNLDIRKIAAWLVGTMLLVSGGCVSKLDYVKNRDIDSEKARKINRFIGCATVFMGVLFLISAFLPPVSTVICVFLLIAVAIVSTLYGIHIGRK